MSSLIPKYPALSYLNPPRAPYVKIDKGVINMTFVNNPPPGFVERDVYPHYTAEQLYKQQGLPIYFTPGPEMSNYPTYNQIQYADARASRRVLQLNTRDALPLYFMKHLEER